MIRSVEVTHIAPAAFGADGLFGGGERYPLALASAMSGLVKTRLIVFGSHQSTRHVADLEVVTLPTRFRWKDGEVNPVSERLAPYLLRSGRLHVHQYHSVVTNLALVVGRWARKDVYVTDHGGRSYDYADRFKLERYVRRFIPVSRFSAGFFPQLADRLAPPIFGGADPTKFFPGSEDRRREAVFVGRLTPHKGVDILIRAVGADIPLRVLGRPYDQSYREELLRLAGGGNVMFNEHATDAEVAEAYRSARVAVLPSVYESSDGGHHPWPELLGLSLLEAMASGTPVIGSRVGGIPEIVREGETGFLVAPNDPVALRGRLTELLRDDGEWRRLSANALAAVRTRFNWQSVAERCLEAYDR